ncbi:MAG TPA: hypothetical protein VJZ72_01460 [Candidatus Limnocylindrales bacterium]|nr:hypothetical protein [Candidatus Limnocylindrales bacterium]
MARSRGIGGDRAINRLFALIGALFLVAGTLLGAIAPAALAVPPGSSVFQLEGDALDNGTGDDWENVDDGNDSAVATFFETDTEGLRFTQGSKDTLDMPSNAWDQQSVPDKDDILHAYAAFYGGADPAIVFGMDRYANNGDANVGFWFFQDDIGINANGTFSGTRTVNDLFIVSEFDSGGDVSTIVVYRWNGSGLTQVDSGADCVAGGAQQDVCALANIDDETAPWSYTPKQGSAGTFPEASFFEGGVLLDEIFPNGIPCFSTFMAETRSSTETVAELKNFLLGNFDTCGTVTIVKDAVPNDAQDFTFDNDADLGADFSLDDDGNATLPNSITFEDVDPGTYEVSETSVPAGWQLVDIDCDDGNSTDAGATATILVGEGEHVTCTFTNEKDGNIVVVKETAPDGSTQSFEFDSDYGSNFNLTDGQSNDSGLLDPGTYSVVELTPAGWDLTNVSCSDGSANTAIDLDPGETVTCTFSNRQEGRIIVVKQTNPDGDPQAFDFAASWDTGANPDFSLSDGQSNDSGLMDPGEYSVSETMPAGWDLTSATCSDGSPVSAIDLDPGETVTCTFTNAKRGHIIVDKVTNPAADPQSFAFDAGGGSYADFALTDQAAPNDQELVQGQYSVAESVPTGWDLTSATCDLGETPDDIDLGPGEIVTCTFTNAKRGHIIVDKVTDPAADPQSFSFDAGGGSYADFALTDQAAPNNQELVPGTYSVNETVPAGWDLTSATCSDSSPVSAIALGAGETVTCTFTNTKRGAIIVEKQTSPDGATEEFDYSGDAAGSISDGEQIVVGNIVPGQYTSTEADPGSDWVLGNIVCSDANSSGDVGSRTATFNVDPGETVTCTFFNSERGRITVIKNVLNEGDQTTFSFTSDYGDPFSLGDGQSDSSDSLDAGAYSVREQLPDGWDLMSIVCLGTLGSSGEADGDTAFIELTDGGSVSCVFTNARPSIDIVKTAADAADGSVYSFLGGSVTFSYEVTNSGPIALEDVVVVDDNGTPGEAADEDDFEADCPKTTLAAGESMTCTATVTVDENRTNVGTASGTSEAGTDVEASDDAVVRIVFFELLIDKSNDAPLVGTLDLPTVEEGDTVTYTLAYTVSTNDVLTGAIITDDLPEGMSYVVDTASSDSQFTFQGYVPDPDDPEADDDLISGTLTWTASEVTENGTLTYDATADEGSAELAQPLHNVAAISSDQTEPDEGESDVFVNPPPLALTPPPTDAFDREVSAGGPNLPLMLLILGALMLIASFMTPAPARIGGRRRRS